MKTAVEFLLRELENKFSNEMQNIYSKNMQLVANICEQAKEMEFQQRKKDFVNGYKARAKGSNLIFDETSEMYAIKLFNETFKSE
jgi:hypothetical protein